MANNPQHSGRISLYSDIRFTYKADYALLQVFDPTSVIYDGRVLYFIKKTVNGQVTPKCIIHRCSKGVVGCQYFFFGIAFVAI